MFPELELKEGWVTVICLLLMLLCVAWAIQAAEWAEGLSTLQAVVIVGGATGIVLAKSRLPNRLAHLLSLLAGWTCSIFLVSRVLAEAGELPGDVAVLELETKFHFLFYAPFIEDAVVENIVFVLLLAFLLWIMAYFSAWAIFRWERVWWAVIVCGVALLVNINETEANLTVYLIMYLLFALLLVVRASVAFYEEEWRQARVGYSPELISAFLRAGLVVSLFVILLAWAAPVALASRPLQPFLERIGEPWRRFQESSSRIFRDLNYQNPPPLVYPSDRRMWFGGPVELEDIPVADVTASDGRYWRIVVFHEYLGNGWVSDDPDTLIIGANKQDLAFPEFDLRYEMTQTITLFRDLTPEDLLIAAPQPLRAGVPIRAAVSFVTHEEDLVRAPDSSLLPQAPGDPSVLHPRELLVAGESYDVLSSLSEPDEESLRQAGTNYPDWVAPRYLELPDSVPNRVLQLAARIGEGYDNAYDKTKAVETYLRQIPYNEQFEGAPLGRDGVDYFLFESEEGYCTYYASSMVVMLRSLGIPARFVQGYLNNQPEEGVFHLLESDGHAWPEVFFPGYGWVEFEPTGGRPPLERPQSQEPAEEDTAAAPIQPPMPPDFRDMIEDEIDPSLLELGFTSEPEAWWQRVGRWGWLAVDLAAFVLVTVALLAVRRRHHVEGLSVAERVYEDLVIWVRRLLDIEPLDHQTPNEYAGIVARNMPRGRQAVEQIAGFYVQERFGGKEVAEAYAEVAWQQARPAIWQRWLERKTHSLRRFWWWLVPPKEIPES